MDYPPCFDSPNQYELWRQAAKSIHPTPGHSYCEDCTSEYQHKMINGKRCRFPGTTFVYGTEGIHGSRPLQIVKKLQSGVDEKTLWVRYA